MSAIYGVVNFGNSLNYDPSLDLKYLDKFKVDRKKSICEKNVFFTCYLQEVTIESKKEVLPYYDEINDCLITADAIIDNRDELFKLLGIEVSDNISDSQLIYELYIRYGHEFPKYLYGDFAVAIYNYETRELILCRDHVGKRTLYYTYDENMVMFSTVEKPISSNSMINKDYMRRFLSISYIVNDFSDNETIYEEIFSVEPAELIVFKNHKCTKTKYWHLERSKENKSVVEQIYEVKKTLHEAVRCRLRSDQKIGIMLSSGLDSSSVAYMAAPILLKRNEKLFAYTSIPINGHDLKYNKHISVDESHLVNLIKEEYSNIELNFLPFEQDNSLTVMPELLCVLDHPYKYIENSYWIKGINEKASFDGCKLLLTGQFGNFTISYDNILNHLKNLLLEGKFLTFNDDLKNYCGEKAYSRKKFLINMIKTQIQKTSNVSLDYQNPYGVLSKMERKKLDEFLLNQKIAYAKFNKKNEAIKYFIKNAFLNHISSIETKFGLYYNIVQRDPTMDVRLIEKCYNLSVHAYNLEGQEKALLKTMMKDIIPAPILHAKKKGLQSADWVHRLINQWEMVRSELHKLITILPDDLIDKEEFLILLDQYKDIDLENLADQFKDIRNILVVYNVCLFYKNETQHL